MTTTTVTIPLEFERDIASLGGSLVPVSDMTISAVLRPDQQTVDLFIGPHRWMTAEVGFVVRRGDRVHVEIETTAEQI